MKLFLGLAALAAILAAAGAPDAHAFMIQGSSRNVAVDGPRVADPDDVQQNLTQSWNGGQTSSLGTFRLGNSTLHFGMSESGGAFRDNDSNWFLESPAARTVPSQR